MEKQKKDYVQIIITVLSCILSFATIVYSVTFFATRARFTAAVLPVALVIIMLNLYYKNTSIKPKPWKNFLIWTVTAVMLISAVYFWIEFYEMLQYRVANYTALDQFFAFIAIPLVVFLAFKSVGSIFGTVICLPFLLVFFGEHLPQPFTVGKVGLTRFLASISLDMGGIWGPLTQAMTTYVGIFVVFAAVVRGFGGLESLIAFFVRLLGKHEVLFPQVATLSSMAFGSFSGSAIANVAGTGTFTIPMMKMRGMKPENAAAVETIASTGGGVMPPIMGASAFIMAELLGTSYMSIIAAGILPALVFYFTTFLNTHWIRLRQIRREAQEAVKRDDKQFEERMAELDKIYDPAILWCLLASLAVLMFLLLRGSSILSAGGRSVIIFCGFYLIKLVLSATMSYKKDPGGNIKSVFKSNAIDFIKCVINGLNEAGKSISEVILLGAALGIISSTLLRTGLLYKLGVQLVKLAMGEPYLLLLVTFILSVLLGMAVSGLATYLLVAPIVVAAFREIGVEPLTAHFIVFYCSMLAPITPPIAPATAVAANLAQASFIKTCKSTLIISQGLILMPLVFLNFPSILQLNGFTFLVMLTAMFLVSMGVYVEFKGMGKIPNLLLIGLGLSIMIYKYPPYISIVLSLITLLLVIYGIKNIGVIKLFGSKQKEMQA